MPIRPLVPLLPLSPLTAASAPSPDMEVWIEPAVPLDLGATLAPLAHGLGDPTTRVSPHEAWHALRTPAGPATLQLSHTSRGVRTRVWGAGAEAALAGVADLIGLTDDPSRLRPRHRVIAELQRQMPGLRLPRSGRPFDALLTAVLEQKVTGFEARRAYRQLVRGYGEPAPGPPGLWLQPRASVLAELPYHAFHPLGVERRRAEVLRAAARLFPRLTAAAADPARVHRLLGSIPGVGPWTLAEVRRVAFGDPDAVSIGDYHLKNRVAWVLAGERQATDARMLDLLAPYAGQRGRVQRLIEAAALGPPRRGPRAAPRNFHDL